MIEHYEVLYKDILIGILFVNICNNTYCYEPDDEGVKKVEKSACLLKVMIEGSKGFIEPIPFFMNRLYNMKRNHLHVINYQTDNYTIREIGY